MGEVARVLVADDELDLIEDYQSALVVPEPRDDDKRLAELQDELFGPRHSITNLPPIELVSVNQGEAAVREISAACKSRRPFSLAFLDVRMPPGINGVEAAKEIRAIDPDLPIVIVTAFTDVQTLDLAKSIPPVERLFLLYKPFHTTEIQQLTSALTAARAAELAGGVRTAPGAEDDFSAQAVLRGLPGGVALFDARGRLVQKNSQLDSLFPEMKDELSIGARYGALRDLLDRRASPERVIRRPGATATDRPLQLSEGGALGLKSIGDNRWMMITEQSLEEGGALVQFLDVTALKLMEQRHEIDRTMTHIARFAEELLRRVEKPDPAATAPGRHGGNDPREAAVTQRLREELQPLTQNLHLEPKGALLDAAVNEVAAELVSDRKNGISLEVVSSVGLWPVCVDVQQLKRALCAIVTNAIEAVAEGGAIRIESANVRVTRDTAMALPGLREGDYVCASVVDNGPGMSPAVINRAFMPFFTTKDQKQHSGTGLTRAYNIVTQSGGCLFIDSDGRSRTEVRLFFPRGSADAVSRAGAEVRH